MKRQINVELLRRVKKHILAEPKRMWMNKWLIQNRDTLEDLDLKIPDCGTVGCISGWGAFLVEGPGAATYMRMDLFGLNDDQAYRLFVPGGWPPEFRTRLNKLKPQGRAYAQTVADYIDYFIKRETAKQRSNAKKQASKKKS
jgi:hypothetical protein